MMVNQLSKICDRVSDMGSNFSSDIMAHEYVQIMHDYFCNVLAVEIEWDNNTAHRHPTRTTHPVLSTFFDIKLEQVWNDIFDNFTSILESKRVRNEDMLAILEYDKFTTDKQVINKSTAKNANKQHSNQELIASAKIIRKLL